MEAKPLKPKKCKICKGEFQPYGTLQPVCSVDCSIKLAVKLREKKERKTHLEIYRKNKILKDKAKTLSKHKKELETVFNAYIRERDIKDPCISCGSTGDFRRTAGHYFPTTHGSVRFNEDNVHVQCWYNCNKNQHGNLSEYLPSLINKIGQERFDEMKRIKNQVTWKPSIPEVILLKLEYKEKLRKKKKGNEKPI